MPWKVRVQTTDGEDRTFESYECAKLTPEQKLLWETRMGEMERITKARVVMLMELKLDANGKPISPYLRKLDDGGES